MKTRTDVVGSWTTGDRRSFSLSENDCLVSGANKRSLRLHRRDFASTQIRYMGIRRIEKRIVCSRIGYACGKLGGV
jgi:hypothetical protein